MMKSKMLEVIAEYSMAELVSDAVTQRQIGWYLMSDEPIPELDALLGTETSPNEAQLERELLATRYRYRIIAPSAWLD